jgi:glycosyltransferase involved in cell wall biosynthesis
MKPQPPAPRILQVLPAFDAGGVERVTFETVTGLMNANVGVHHVASAGGRFADQLPQDVLHHRIPLNTKNPVRILTNVNRLYKLIKRHKIDILHGRSRAPAWSALLACRLAKISFITTYHGTYNSKSKIKQFYNSIMVRGDRVIAISKFIMNHIEKTHPKLLSKLIFVPEGIDTNYFDPSSVTPGRITTVRTVFDIPQDATVFVLPGRLTRWKGQAWFLKTLHRCAELLKQHNVHVILLGDAQGRDSYRDELIQLAQPLTHPMAQHQIPVRFITEYNDLPALYALANIVFSCSLEPEAFGRIAAESLSMERPFIGTNHGGTVELTGEGRFGSVVAPGDDDALITAIEETLNTDKDTLAKRGELARAHIIKHYSLIEMLRLTQNLYESVL